MRRTIFCTHADELTALVVDACPAGEPRRREIAVHLVTGCDRCWTAVQGLRKMAARRPSRDPIAEALARLARPARWPELPAHHFFALKNVRSPWGFIDLVLTEASLLAKGARPSEPPARAFLSPIYLGGELTRRCFSQSDIAIYRAKLHAERAYIAALRGDNANAERLLHLACRIENTFGTSGARTAIYRTDRILARRRGDVAGYADDSRALIQSYPDAEHPYHAAEILAEVTEECGFPRRLVSACAVLARDLHRRLEMTADPLLRLHGLYRATWLDAVLGRASEMPENARLPDLLEAAETLAEADELIKTHGNDELRFIRLVCLVKLFTALDERRAGIYQQELDDLLDERGRPTPLEILLSREDVWQEQGASRETVH